MTLILDAGGVSALAGQQHGGRSRDGGPPTPRSDGGDAYRARVRQCAGSADGAIGEMLAAVEQMGGQRRECG